MVCDPQNGAWQLPHAKSAWLAGPTAWVETAVLLSGPGL
jgi:hypothetical protein